MNGVPTIYPSLKIKLTLVWSLSFIGKRCAVSDVRSLHLCPGAPTTNQSYAGFRHDRSDPLRTWSSRSQQRLKLQRNRGHGRRHAYGIVGPSRPTPPLLYCVPKSIYLLY
jgi:hypothetical protein